MDIVTTAQQQTIAAQSPDWSQDLSFAQFAPVLGTLDSVGVNLTGAITGSVSIESLEAAASSVSASLDGSVSLAGPAGVTAAVSAEASASASLAADASTVLSGLSGTATAQALLQPSEAVLSAFVGTGSIPLSVISDGALQVSGPANLLIASQASTDATVGLQYTYTTPASGSDANGSSDSDFYLAAGVVAAVGLPELPTPFLITTPPQTVSFADQTTGWTSAATIQQFDPTWGTLEAVNITLSGNEAASVAAENGDSEASALFTSQTATLNLDLPDGTTALSAAATIDNTMSLGAYDGIADFAGTSGQIDQGLTQTALNTITLSDPADLTLFTGSGTVALPLSAVGTSTLDGPANLLARLLAQAGATVSVSYTYASPEALADSPIQVSSPLPAGDIVITQPGTSILVAQSAHSVVLDAPGAVLVLDAPLNVTAGFTLEAGTLEFNGGWLTVGSFEQDGGVVLGGSVDIDASGSIDLNAGTIDCGHVTLSAGTSIDVGNAINSINGGSLTAGTFVSITGTLTAGTLAAEAGTIGTIEAGNTIDPIGTFAIDSLGLVDDDAITVAGSLVADGWVGTSPPIVAVGSSTTETLPPGTALLHGAADQYEIADAAGTLYVQDTVSGRDGTQILTGDTAVVFSNGIGVFDPTGTAEDIARLYGAGLDRAPDAGGLAYWTTAVNSGNVSLADVANSFAASPEFIADYGTLSDAGFVNQLYENVLGRTADASGAQYWDGVLAAGASRGAVLVGFAESPENEAATISTAGDPNNAEVYRLYEATLGRAPDAAGQAYWAAALANGATPTQVAQDLVGSTEFQQDYGTLSASDFVSTLYENVLHRAADSTGLAYWTGLLQQGASEASVVVGLADSPENLAATSAATHANWVFIPS